VAVAEGAAGTGAPPFPGAVGVSHLRVYDTAGPDGVVGGSPHLHTACTEAYAVIAGAGSVQTLSGDGFGEVPLRPGAFVWFTPGTVHRLVNAGDLEILVLMGNAGLPEAGDLVLSFPDDVLADPGAYAAAAVLGAREATTAGSGQGARTRRDLAVEGFVGLRAAVEAHGPGALAPFHRRAASLVRDRVDGWRAVWEEGPVAATATTGAHLAALAAGDPSHLAASGVHHLPPPAAERRMGCCGTLGTFLP
jgi:mannose-6-phosphate isomerase-like protein (cupin superfamily)